jgi:hypothetical protein
MDIRNGYWIGGPVELSRSLRRHDFPKTIDIQDRTSRAIPVATDGGGNVFMLAEIDGSVWRRNHDTAAVQHVAQDFVAFLNRVAVDWMHDLEGDERWTYLV